jgi:RNA polymerase sigma-70 factor (ECF subfamily)
MSKLDTSFFEQLYRDYQQDVFRFSYWLCGQPDEAKDITAETFIRLWTAKSDIQAETVKGYLLTIARNIYLQKHRKTKEHVELRDELVDPAPHLDNVMATKAELGVVIKGLQELSGIERTVLFMKAYEGLSYKEISQLLKLSIPALKVKVHRARVKLLKSKLEE